jgi:hypothetical protein
MNGAERRRLRAMGERVDHKPDADRDFFRRFPHIRYRVRRICEGERAEFERMGSTSASGLAEFVAIKQIFRGGAGAVSWPPTVLSPAASTKERVDHFGAAFPTGGHAVVRCCRRPRGIVSKLLR